jgi:hypothetical protein
MVGTVIQVAPAPSQVGLETADVMRNHSYHNRLLTVSSEG